MNFLKENWLWIAAPVVIILALLVFLMMQTEGNSDSPFIYNIW